MTEISASRFSAKIASSTCHECQRSSEVLRGPQRSSERSSEVISQSDELYLPSPSTIVQDIREILLGRPSERRYVPPHGIRSHRLHHRLSQLLRRRPRTQEEAHRMEQAAVVVRLRDGGSGRALWWAGERCEECTQAGTRARRRDLRWRSTRTCRCVGAAEGCIRSSTGSLVVRKSKDAAGIVRNSKE